MACRFNFGQFFTDKTIVAEPLPEDVSEEVKTNILTRRKEILCSVKQKINEVLDPNKAGYNPLLNQSSIFQDAGVTKEDYQWALSISPAP